MIRSAYNAERPQQAKRQKKPDKRETCAGKVVDSQVADRLDQVERQPRHCLEPGHGIRPRSWAARVCTLVKEVDETRVLVPAARIVAVGQGRDAPRRKQHADRWARCQRDEPVDHPVLILRKKSLERVPQSEPRGDTGHQASRTVGHPGTHIDGYGRTGR